ncbi:hypothetical protein SCARR_00739 [Pontiella sulfatireligans]|uniref:VWFA domain-containing protein n=2 Tax=Pontiella sulfatireligans TaxID=2750658 RepID=A0A6C2UHK5_9BACT|nr:hypothetical protein SCARR_00739 [Pontiella sulfatireligans]
MSVKPRKRFFANHAKSSAVLVSLAVHAALILVALSFVAVTVITKDEQKFEGKPVKRPKMTMKKLQVPVNIKKKKVQKPKLRKRIVVQPKMNQMPDIKMPEITGVKGGLGSVAGDGLGGAGGVGFSMPEIELFGIKSKGEKVFIILDASGDMMVDEIGGIPAYEIIKEELVRILEGLNSTVLFNIAVYGGGDYTLFLNLVPASAGNVAKVKKWLEPLNALTKDMGDKDYGPKTLGPGGISIPWGNQIEPLESSIGYWARPMVRAMEQQADSVFVLSCSWGFLAYKTDDAEVWSESKMTRWKEKVELSKIKFKEDNDLRREKGEPPRVLPNSNQDRHRVRIYFPNEPQPPHPKFITYTPKEVLEAFDNTRKKFKSKIPTTSGLGKSKKKEKYAINVIHFVKTDDSDGDDERFKKITTLTRGGYRRIQGMEAIESSIQ